VIVLPSEIVGDYPDYVSLGFLSLPWRSHMELAIMSKVA
jgi:hypothetical protein